MDSDHNHGHGIDIARGGSRYRNRLLAALLIIFSFFVVEVIAGLLTNSLALLSDAGHMFTDVLGLAMAWGATTLAGRRTGPHRTYGLYRLEVLAALANAILLFGVAGWVLYEAVERFGEPTEVSSGPMLAVAFAGLMANLAAFLILRSGANESINVRGAYLEVVADSLGSVGVIIAAIIIETTGWQWADPLVAVGIGVFVLPRTWRLARSALRILTEASPNHIDVVLIKSQLNNIQGVLEVHDLHVWTVTSGMETATAHLVVELSADTHAVLDQARQLLAVTFGVKHATLQIEPEDHEACDEVGW